MYTYIPISPPSCISLPPTPPSHPSRWTQSTELISLCYAAASHQPSILHLIAYMCQCYSLTSSQLPFPPVSSSPFSTSASLFLPCHQVHRYHFFRFHIYALAWCICFSLSDLLHSVWQTLGPSTSLQITHFPSILWKSNIPLCIFATSSLSIHLSMDIQVASLSWLL